MLKVGLTIWVLALQRFTTALKIGPWRKRLRKNSTGVFLSLTRNSDCFDGGGRSRSQRDGRSEASKNKIANPVISRKVVKSLIDKRSGRKWVMPRDVSTPNTTFKAVWILSHNKASAVSSGTEHRAPSPVGVCRIEAQITQTRHGASVVKNQAGVRYG